MATDDSKYGIGPAYVFVRDAHSLAFARQNHARRANISPPLRVIKTQIRVNSILHVIFGLFCLHIVFGTISCMANVANSCFRSGYARRALQERTYVARHRCASERDGCRFVQRVFYWWRMRTGVLVHRLAASRALGGSNEVFAGEILTLAVLPCSSTVCMCAVCLCMCLIDSSFVRGVRCYGEPW